jgi:glycosyltransferase involved in cell wall biosynthesis
MKKILFITSKSLGGSGKYISSLAAALRTKGYHCELLYYPSGVAQDDEIEAAFAKVHHFPLSPGFSPVNIIKNTMKVRAIVDQNDFDWVHTHTSLGGLIGKVGARLAHKKVAVGATLHAFAADEFTPVPQKWIYWIIERFLDALTDAYVAPSHYMVAYGKRIRVINPDKATVIHNSLPLRAPPSSVTATGSAKRASLGIGADEIVFLFCGRLEEQKGVDTLIAGFAQVPAALRCRLVICGIGEDEQELKAQAAALNVDSRIHWAGWQSDVEPFYAMADVYVMPSRWESFGLVFLEAMNFSLPVVSTRTQAIPEVVADQKTGLLGGNGDVKALATNMTLLATDAELRRTMGLAGKVRLLEHFTFERFVEEHMAWYSHASARVLRS